MIGENNKILLIVPAPLQNAPYVDIYKQIFIEHQIPYDILFWNTSVSESAEYDNNVYSYNVEYDIKAHFLKKTLKGIGFAKYAKKIIAEGQYSRIIVFTIQYAILLSSILFRRFPNRFIVDIRDYSPIYKIPLIQRIFKHIVQSSAKIVISSPGFLNWLCVSDNISKVYISHNVKKSQIVSTNYQQPKKKARLEILTIGQIRDYEANSHIISELANNSLYKIVFAGAGHAISPLKQYVCKRRINNVSFSGRYNKCDEDKIVMEADMINAYFCHNINSDSLMSNRFYLAVRHRKPIIVNEGCYQAEQVKKYGLGMVVSKIDNISDCIVKYWQTFNYEYYNANCRRYLEMVLEDIYKFESALISFCKDNAIKKNRF